MKDNLQDLIQHTNGLGNVDLIKIVGTQTSTEMYAVSEDKSVLLFGNFKNPITEFEGTFGMPNLGKLKTILGFDEYDDSAIINVTRQSHGTDPSVPSAIHFETKNKGPRI